MARGTEPVSITEAANASETYDQFGELRFDPTRQRRRFSALPSRERSHHQLTSHQKPYLTARIGLNSRLGPTSSMINRTCERD
jgi:hypothetical protein